MAGSAPRAQRATDAAWRDYEALCAIVDARYARWRAAAADQALLAIRRAAAVRRPAPPPRHISFEQVVRLAHLNGRVCPRAGPWRCLYVLLPLVPDVRKQLALHAQLEWAQRHGALVRLHDCLAALREQDWHHLPELAWPRLEAGAG